MGLASSVSDLCQCLIDSGNHVHYGCLPHLTFRRRQVQQPVECDVLTIIDLERH